MTEHHAISRRAFTLGLGLAALSPLASLPETATLGIPLRAAFADDAATASVSLDKFVIRLRPAGYFRTASVNQDGNIKGNVCHLFNDGTSSKLILEHVVTDTKKYKLVCHPHPAQFRRAQEDGLQHLVGRWRLGQRWKGHPRMEWRA